MKMQKQFDLFPTSEEEVASLACISHRCTLNNGRHCLVTHADLQVILMLRVLKGKGAEKTSGEKETE